MADYRTTPGGSELPPENLAGARDLPAGHALPGGPEGVVEPVRTVRVDDDHLLAERAGPGEPGQIAATDDPDVVRTEIEETRARMSSTIDEIEEVLLRKKEKIQERMDVMAPVKERVRDQPLVLFGSVFAAGLVLGWLTGGDDDDKEVKELLKAARSQGGLAVLAGEVAEEEDRGWKGRAREWEKQSRRLMKENSRQEEELRLLRAQLQARSGVEYEEEESRGGWRDAVSGALAGIFRRGSRTEVDVEFHPDAELEQETSGEMRGYGEYGRVYDEASLGDGSPGLERGGYDTGYAGGYDNDVYPGNQLPG